MSIFPTKILLATDGSQEARQAAQAAAELSKDTGSEVHITYVLPSPRELRGHHTYSKTLGVNYLHAQFERKVPTN
jgi:nucleotide-binding universal stress UspA family protein